MTLDELKIKVGRQSAPVGDPPHPMALPWWVVVLSRTPNKDGSPRFKFDFGYSTKEEAEARKAARDAQESIRVGTANARRLQQAITEQLPPESIHLEDAIKFFVIERPEGGRL